MRRTVLAFAGCLGLAFATSAFAQQKIPPLPEGEGRELVEFHCSICHDLVLVRQQRLSAGVWNEILDRMKTFGAVFDAEQRARIFEYLSKNLGP